MMNGLGPLARIRVGFFFGINQLLSPDAELAQGNARQIDQLKRTMQAQDRMHLPLQLLLVQALESWGKGHIMENRFHQRAIERGACIQRGNGLSLLVLNRAESGITLQARIELRSGVINPIVMDGKNQPLLFPFVGLGAGVARTKPSQLRQFGCIPHKNRLSRRVSCTVCMPRNRRFC